MPRFLGTRDFNLIQHFNRELVSDVIDSTVILYKMVVATTKVNIYGEAPAKQRYTGITLKAIIRYPQNKPDTSVGIGVDQIQNVEFRFVRKMLEEVNVHPDEGDIIGYNNAFYEISNVSDTQLLGSQPYNTHSILCSAHLTRRSSIQIEEGNT